MVYERQTTDLGFGICFLVFVVAFFGIGAYAFAKGNLNNIFIFADGDNQFCGSKGHNTTEPYTEFKYLYFPRTDSTNIQYLFSQSICVNKCPKSKDDIVKCHQTRNNTICPTSFYPTSTFLGFNICLPTDAKDDVFSELKQQIENPD